MGSCPPQGCLALFRGSGTGFPGFPALEGKQKQLPKELWGHVGCRWCLGSGDLIPSSDLTMDLLSGLDNSYKLFIKGLEKVTLGSLCPNARDGGVEEGGKGAGAGQGWHRHLDPAPSPGNS